MAYTYQNSFSSLFIEVTSGIIVLINIYYMIHGKIFSFYIVLAISGLLTIYYGYNFYQTHDFFQVVMSGISFFIAIYQIIKIFNLAGPEE